MLVDKLILRDFRGVCGELSLDLDASLTVVEAPNGTGKTSVCDGLEWALVGASRRLGLGWKDARLTNFWAQEKRRSARGEVELILGALGTWRRRVSEQKLHHSAAPGEWVQSAELDQRVYDGGPPPMYNSRVDARRAWLAAARFFWANGVEVYVDAATDLDDPVVRRTRCDLLSGSLGVEDLERDLTELRRLLSELESVCRKAASGIEAAQQSLAAIRANAASAAGASGQGVDTASLVLDELARTYGLGTDGLATDALAASVEATVGRESAALTTMQHALDLLQNADLEDEATIHDAEALVQAARDALFERSTVRAARSAAETHHAGLVRLEASLPDLAAQCDAWNEAAAAFARSTEALARLDREESIRAVGAAAREVERLEASLAEVSAWAGELQALWGRRTAPEPDGDCPLCGHRHADADALAHAVAAASERGLGAAGAALRDALAAARARLDHLRVGLAQIDAAVAAHMADQERMDGLRRAWGDERAAARASGIALPEEPPDRGGYVAIVQSVTEAMSAAAWALSALPAVPPSDDDLEANLRVESEKAAAVHQRRTELHHAWAQLAGDQPFSEERHRAIRAGYADRLAAVAADLVRLREARATLRSAAATAQVEKAEAKLAWARGYSAALARRRDALLGAVAQRREESARIMKARLEPLRAPIEALYRRNCLSSVWHELDAEREPKSGALQWLLRHSSDAAEPVNLKDLSAGQRQDLALAVFLTQARQLGGTFVLDDPFLHLDGWNRLSYLDVLRTMVLESRSLDAKPLRFVITTANSDLARLFAEKFHLVPPGADGGPVFRHYRLSGDPREGTRAHLVQESPAPPP